MEKYQICDYADTWAREPVIAKMKNGTIVCAYISNGPTEPHNDNKVYYTKSYDDGETWTEPVVLFEHTHWGCWATEIFNEGENPFMIVHTYEGNCPYKALQTFISYTYDNGETWTEPVTFSKYINGICLRRGIEMSNGEWLFPIYHTVSEEGYFDWKDKKIGDSNFWDGTKHCSGVIVSSDKGESWQRCGNFENTGNVWEPNAEELEDGHILVVARDSGESKLGMSESFDYGRTWTPYKMSAFENADSKVTLIKVNGKLVMVFNESPNTHKFEDRIRLSIRISDDNAKTWREPIYVEDEKAHLFYPHAIYDDEKQIFYLAYENARQFYLKKYTYKELGLD